MEGKVERFDKATGSKSRGIVMGHCRRLRRRRSGHVIGVFSAVG